MGTPSSKPYRQALCDRSNADLIAETLHIAADMESLADGRQSGFAKLMREIAIRLRRASAARQTVVADDGALEIDQLRNALSAVRERTAAVFEDCASGHAGHRNPMAALEDILAILDQLDEQSA